VFGGFDVNRALTVLGFPDDITAADLVSRLLVPLRSAANKS
jgi:hypothetical protein